METDFKKEKEEVIFLLGQLEQFGKQYVKMKMKNRKNWTHILHIKADLTLHSPKLPTPCWKCYFCECFRFSKFYKMCPYLFFCSIIVLRHVLDFILIGSQDRTAPSSDWLLSHAARSIRGRKRAFKRMISRPLERSCMRCANKAAYNNYILLELGKNGRRGRRKKNTHSDWSVWCGLLG